MAVPGEARILGRVGLGMAGQDRAKQGYGLPNGGNPPQDRG